MTERILIVDDDEIMRTILAEAVGVAGYVAETAEDGLVAWQMLDADPARFDLMLLDKQMPRLDGIGLLRRVKGDGRFQEFPIVMLTGDVQQHDIVDSLAEGAYYYLTKPPAEEVLTQVIRSALEIYRAQRELRAHVGRRKSSLKNLCRAEFRYRTLEDARDLALWLADASQDAERTVHGYSELLVNAVEHGNLGIGYAEKGLLVGQGIWADEIASRLTRSPYCERWVSVNVEIASGACRVRIVDEGEGFAWEDYLDFSPERAFDLNGRGIAMAKALSFDALEYSGNGNTVTTTVMLRTGTS